jgi:anti-sigma regulatory factor (Ser/Thr protein kinase)
MRLAPQIAVAVGEPNQAGEARRAAVRLAESIGFDEQARGEVAIVATELATNLARYARHGSLLLHALDLPAGRAIEILSIDAGPGMADVRACLQDGYSTGGTPGNGLGAVRRLSTLFDIFSGPGGTAIVSRVSRAADPRRPPSGFDWGVVSLPVPGEQVCGDAWRIAEGEAGCAVMVADGLGHGPLAAEASRLAGNVFDERPFDDAVALIERAHRALAGSRGAALAIATIGGGGLRYAGVGNIAGVLNGGERARGLASQNGTVGVQMRRTMPLEYPWPPSGRLVMHSDGLSSRWTLESYPGLALRHPAVAAAVLWRDCGRGRDDATIVVVGRSTAVPNHG